MSDTIKYSPKYGVFKTRNVCIDHNLGIAFDVINCDILAQQVDASTWCISKEDHRSGGWGRRSSGDYQRANMICHIRKFLNYFGFNVVQIKDCELYTEIFDQKYSLQKEVTKVKNQRLRDAMFAEIEELIKSREIKRDTISFNIDKILKKRAQRIKKVERALKKNQSMVVDNQVLSFYDKSGQLIVNAREFRGNSQDVYLEVPDSMLLEQYYLRKIAKKSILLPLNVFEAAQLNLAETEIVERGPEEKINGRHFAGAMLLKNKENYFLFDVDRNEVKHGIFNAFLSKLPRACSSIVDAYDSLKPEAVKQAELAGIEVKRQGEWFLIKRPDKFETCSPLNNWQGTTGTFKGEQIRVTLGEVRQGNSRPNRVHLIKYGSENIGLGEISHTGREHKTLDLGKTTFRKEGDTMNQWSRYDTWTIIPNNSVGNFTIEGNVD